MQVLFRSSFPLIAGAVIVFCGCAGERRQEPAQGGPAGSDYAGRTLAVILPDSGSTTLGSAPALDYSLLHEFPGPPGENSRSVLTREFGNAFWSGFAPAVDYVLPIRVPDSVPPAPTGRRVRLTVPTSHGQPMHTYSAPDSGWLEEHGIKADLVLCVGPLKASLQEEELQAFQFGGSITKSRILLQGWYLLWDYSKGRAIAQGPFTTKLEYRGQLKGRDWMKAFDQAMQSIGEATPFRGPKWYRR
ncbi:MAG: hypothetical protein JF616_14575 [Fibrobacteres bacterium]|nr:hypothetical protein [Fibrobacterota bacterium]